MNQEQQQKSNFLFNKFVSNASASDISKITAKIGGMNKGKLTEVWDKIQQLLKMIADPSAPWTGKAVAIGALLYVISPIDAIPDLIPLLGLTDDAAIVLFAISQLKSDLNKYK